MQKNLRIRAIAAGLSIAAAAFGQTAQTPKATDGKAPAKQTTAGKQAEGKPANGSGGMLIAIDPVTKEIRQPTAAEIQLLGASSSVTTGTVGTPQQIVVGPRGGIGVFVPPSAHSYVVVKKTADGKLKTECVTGEETAQKAVKGPVVEVASDK